ncbi:MAG: SpoIID/LytB domain-containing protein [Carboxydocellales bacterium]
MTLKLNRWKLVVLLTFITLVGILVVSNAKGAIALSPKLIRVGLLTNSPGTALSFGAGYQLVDKATGKAICELTANDQVQFTPEGLGEVAILAAAGTTTIQTGAELYSLGQDGNPVKTMLEQIFMTAEDTVPRLTRGITVSTSQQAFGTFAGPIVVRKILPDGEGLVSLGNKQYRGNMEVRLDSNNSLTVINELPLEQYLYGVVASEMPSSWPLEGLKAQAVAARNYALRQQQTGRFSANGFDVTATDLSQVYGGFGSEKEKTTTAVDATRGVVMLAEGKPINAVYHSSSGGYTENSEEVWNYPASYLKTKLDTLDVNTSHYNWQFPLTGFMTMEEAKTKLQAIKGWSFGTITNLAAEKMTASGSRIQILRIEGTDPTGNPKVEKLFNADIVRSAFGLKSAPKEIILNLGVDGKLQGVVFKGSGWGHGVGMSQWGARGMAQAGNDYRTILQYYYTGVTIAENYAE